MKDCDVVKLSKCFWCGGEKNELLFLARRNRAWCENKNTSIIADYEPCDKCEEDFSKGTLVMEASTMPVAEGQPAMQEDVYPTGRVWVIKTESAKEIFGTDSPKVFVDEETAKAIGLYGNENE